MHDENQASIVPGKPDETCHGIRHQAAPLIWQDGFPVGNGFLGAMIWGDGDPLRERARARKAATSAPSEGMGGAAGATASSTTTCPARSSRDSAGYSEPNDTDDQGPITSVMRFFSS